MKFKSKYRTQISSFLAFGSAVVKKRSVQAAGLLLALVFCGYLMFVNYLEPTYVGIARNTITGDMWLQDAAGIHFTWPWVRVARIPTCPLRVSVLSAGRGFSSKLVQFDPVYWREFVQVEGFHYYWWYNRFSFNWGYQEEYRGARDIMRGHAYSPKQYLFIKELAEYEESTR
jgi:hypothetical protein